MGCVYVCVCVSCIHIHTCVWFYVYVCIYTYIITHKCTVQRNFRKRIQPTQCSGKKSEHIKHSGALLIPSSPLPVPAKGNHYSDV